jgi:Acetoacetate decarboxylase (ADC)
MTAPPAPAAPWRSVIDAVLWWHAATPAARGALPSPLAARAGLPVTIGGLVSYREGPVGPYDEILGAPVLLRPLVAHVPFIAVDSQRSVAGGRGNWALPKVMASFEGDVGRPGRATAAGDGWAVAVTTTARRRSLPFAGRLRCEQVWPDGRPRAFSARVRGRMRLGHAEVEHAAASPLAEWLVRGRHPALLLSGIQDVLAPRP